MGLNTFADSSDHECREVYMLKIKRPWTRMVRMSGVKLLNLWVEEEGSCIHIHLMNSRGKKINLLHKLDIHIAYTLKFEKENQIKSLGLLT